MPTVTEITCPICQHQCRETKNLRYWHCSFCDFIFLSPQHRLNAEDEKQRYLLHNNDIQNTGYLDFLNQMIGQIAKLAPSSTTTTVLDFGSGPNPVLSQLLKSHGYQVEIYDPFFAPNPNALEKNYDVIVLNEVLEHCFEPLTTLKKLEKCLNHKGKICIQMKLHPGIENFHNWWYARDPTHVSFFSKKTLQMGIPETIRSKIILVT